MKKLILIAISILCVNCMADTTNRWITLNFDKTTSGFGYVTNNGASTNYISFQTNLVAATNFTSLTVSNWSYHVAKSNVNMAGLIISNGIIVPSKLSSDPAAVQGGLYFNTTTFKFFKCTNGTTWVELETL